MIVRDRVMALPELPIIHWPTTGRPVADRQQTIWNTISKRPLLIEEVITFGYLGNSDRFLFGDDCHSAEHDFRWTKSAVCRIAFNALFDGPAVLLLRLQLMVERPWEDLKLAITLNGKSLNAMKPPHESNLIRLSVGNLLMPSDRPNLLIIHSEPVIVSEIIGGADMRSVGVGLKELWFTREG